MTTLSSLHCIVLRLLGVLDEVKKKSLRASHISPSVRDLSASMVGQIVLKYCDMTPERRKCAVGEAPQEASIARQRLARHVSLAMDRSVETKALVRN
jgi:hypothetical protein